MLCLFSSMCHSEKKRATAQIWYLEKRNICWRKFGNSEHRTFVLLLHTNNLAFVDLIYACTCVLSFMLILFCCCCRFVLLYLKLVSNSSLPLWFCRCGVASCLLHTGVPVCAATLWHSPGGIHFRPDRDRMASMHKHDWCLQYCEMGTSCVSSVISVLHVQVLEENTERRLDVPGGNTALCYRYYAQ